MCKPDHAIASCLASRIAGTVTLERGSVMMKGEAVDLDDQSLCQPKGIHLVSEHQDIGLWKGKAVLPTEIDESIL